MVDYTRGHNNRVLDPKSGFSVADLIRYYRAVAPVLLPHLRGRPISFRRFPAALDGEFYWEKDAPAFTPAWIKTVRIPRTTREQDLHYILVEDERTLQWAASVGCVEVHPFLHCYQEITRPRSMVFDLDPGEGAGLSQCCAIALLLHEFFAGLGLQVFPKVSGGKGMQVYLPLNTPVTYAATQAFAEKVAEKLAEQKPELVVSDSAKALRRNKVFIDWGQNSQQKTNVAVYSLRVVGVEPRVSMPFQWQEIETALRTNDVAELEFSPDAAIERVRQRGDLFAPMLSLHQELPQQLLRDWTIISAPATLISLDRSSRSSGKPAARSSGQGGRREFIVYRTGKMEQEIALRIGEEFRTWKLSRPLQNGTDRDICASEITSVTSQVSARRFPTWDEGTYEMVEGSYTSGQMRLYFSGSKLKGEWALTREKGQWRFQQEAVSPEQAKALLARRETQQPSPAAGQSQVRILSSRRVDQESLPAGQPRFFEPMEADEVDRPEELPANSAEWLYEIKWDGYRAIAVKKNGRVRLYGRSGKPLENCRHEHLDQALADSEFSDGVLDGEIVAFHNGIASFQTLQNTLRNNAPVVFVVFDLLNYHGRDLTPLSYVDRRALLSKLQPILPSLFPISESIDADVLGLLKTFEQKKIEGVVAKRRDAYYRPGKTSHGWVKYWIGELGEFIIGGYMPGKDRYFEALAVGEYRDGQLIYREQIRHGFTIADKQAILAAIKEDEIPQSPFENLPQRKRRGAVDDLRMDQYIWVQPRLHCLMRYKERTAAGEIREHGKFIKMLDREAA
jgi:bifunctional non-homologous end joining protein LigD